ncbi:MAG: 50S ribosomal protein L19 [Rickettsiales bacterium]|jgi:large subunit ribosomal protein L19|nr:50S ribosomal protein L19 [Rickettsiales bacterium]
MVNLLEKFNNEKKQKRADFSGKFIKFNVGDVVSVAYKITEGATTRIQNFEGVVLAKSKKPDSYNSSFVVRKISDGVGVERKFLFHSPLVDSIKLVRSGIVNRAKLYYLRKLTGKATRIKEDLSNLKKNATV